jgi:hypothetical protein
MPGYQGEVEKGLAHLKRVHISRIFSPSPRLISDYPHPLQRKISLLIPRSKNFIAPGARSLRKPGRSLPNFHPAGVDLRGV